MPYKAAHDLNWSDNWTVPSLSDPWGRAMEDHVADHKGCEPNRLSRRPSGVQKMGELVSRRVDQLVGPRSLAGCCGGRGGVARSLGTPPSPPAFCSHMAASVCSGGRAPRRAGAGLSRVTSWHFASCGCADRPARPGPGARALSFGQMPSGQRRGVPGDPGDLGGPTAMGSAGADTAPGHRPWNGLVLGVAPLGQQTTAGTLAWWGVGLPSWVAA